MANHVLMLLSHPESYAFDQRMLESHSQVRAPSVVLCLLGPQIGEHRIKPRILPLESAPLMLQKSKVSRPRPGFTLLDILQLGFTSV